MIGEAMMLIRKSVAADRAAIAGIINEPAQAYRGVMGIQDKGSSASWTSEFYQRNGFALVPDSDKDRLLRTYWSIPSRQIEASVVPADARWTDAGGARQA